MLTAPQPPTLARADDGSGAANSGGPLAAAKAAGGGAPRMSMPAAGGRQSGAFTGDVAKLRDQLTDLTM